MHGKAKHLKATIINDNRLAGTIFKKIVHFTSPHPARLSCESWYCDGEKHFFIFLFTKLSNLSRIHEILLWEEGQILYARFIVGRIIFLYACFYE
jgi:hypothetical protein